VIGFLGGLRGEKKAVLLEALISNQTLDLGLWSRRSRRGSQTCRKKHLASRSLEEELSVGQWETAGADSVERLFHHQGTKTPSKANFLKGV
jgi:hypothetical protein